MAKKKAGSFRPRRAPLHPVRQKSGQVRFEQLCGWQNKPEEVARISTTSDRWFPSFEAAAPNQTTDDDDQYQDTFLWDAELKVLGHLLAAFHQTLGTCVSQGWGRFIQDQILINIMLGLSTERWVAPVATEPLYVGSRIEIGGGQLGNSQGSIGAWMARFVQQWGYLLRVKYGSFDFRTPNDDWAQRFGSSRDGLPEELEKIARKHPVAFVAPVRAAVEARTSLCNWRGIPVCSNVGFTGNRDAEGFDYASGTWNHCMYIRGYFVARGRNGKKRKAFIIQQSWGDQPTGPNKIYTHSGRVIELPEGCFAVDWDTIDRMLKQGDSFTGADVKGFTARKFKKGVLA